MNIPDIFPGARESVEPAGSLRGDHFLVLIPRGVDTADTPRYLITLDKGIGDAIRPGFSKEAYNPKGRDFFDHTYYA